MKILFILIGTLLAYGHAAAQRGIIQFDKSTLDLGTVTADDAPVKAAYTFKNAGDAPVIISQVTPYASRVNATWDKAPIVPGATSKITLSFVPAEQAEDINYTIQIVSNAQNRNERLQLLAKIVDNPKKPYLLYKYDMDSIRFKEQAISLGNIFTDQSKKDTLYFYNTWNKAVKVGIRHKQPHLNVAFVPEEVAPGQKGMMITTFDAKVKNDFGYVYDNLILSFNNDNSYNNRISLNAYIREDFSGLSEKELTDAPVALFEKTTIEFGTLKMGAKANCDFTLTNTGKSNLIIRKTKASCGCTAVTLGETSILPGKSTMIRASFDSAGKRGRQHKSITVITNDPKKPEMILTISGDVAE